MNFVASRLQISRRQDLGPSASRHPDPHNVLEVPKKITQKPTSRSPEFKLIPSNGTQAPSCNRGARSGNLKHVQVDHQSSSRSPPLHPYLPVGAAQYTRPYTAFRPESDVACHAGLTLTCCLGSSLVLPRLSDW